MGRHVEQRPVKRQQRFLPAVVLLVVLLVVVFLVVVLLLVMVVGPGDGRGANEQRQSKQHGYELLRH